MTITRRLFLLIFLCIQSSACEQAPQLKQYITYPANHSKDINPDTHLTLYFHKQPQLGNSGKIRIYDADTYRLIDSLDMSIPPGPTIPNKTKVPYIATPYPYNSSNATNANTLAGTPTAGAAPTFRDYQLTIIGHFTDGFHFYPVIIHDTVATIYPHNNLLQYGKSYYVTIDPGVLTLPDSSFDGITPKDQWTFGTKATAPSADKEQYVVAADGSGDFNTVQGAMDFISDSSAKRITVFIKNDTYEEIVYFRNKTNISLIGESRDGVRICYANNEVFNPHPANIATNEKEGTFPSRRAAFTVDHSSGISLKNMTIESINPKPAQAEGLLINGSENIVYNITIIGSGDALQSNGSAYYENVSLTGIGDNILGRGPSFFKDCELITTGGPHIWVRNTDANHGDVFVNCIFRTLGDKEAVIARSPENHGRSYPFAEAVLINCQLDGVRPAGFDPIGGDTKHVHFWEYNSTDLQTGKPIDYSQRHPATKVLEMPKDSVMIANYSNPAFVLGGWMPNEGE